MSTYLWVFAGIVVRFNVGLVEAKPSVNRKVAIKKVVSENKAISSSRPAPRRRNHNPNYRPEA